MNTSGLKLESCNRQRRTHMKKNHQLIWTLILLMTTFAFAGEEQKRRMPDYNKRDEWQQPEKILDTIGIKPGMVVADIGAGEGFFTFRLAKRVGPEGKIYANEIDEERLKVIKDRMQKEDIENIVTVLGKEDDPKLPKGEMDVVLMVHVFRIVYRDQNPSLFLEKIRTSLKPDGLLVLVEWEYSKLGLKDASYDYTEEQFKLVMENSGFVIVRTETFLEYDKIYMLRMK